MLTKSSFIAWLIRIGFVAVAGAPDTFEKGDWRYTARMQSLAVRNRLSPNRWSAEETCRYNRRYITPEGKLGWR